MTVAPDTFALLPTFELDITLYGVLVYAEQTRVGAVTEGGGGGVR
jgi:hypothetical protein